MRRLLGPFLLLCVLALVGCADSGSSTATDHATPSPTFSDPAPTEPMTIAIVSETAAGGEVDVHAVRMDDDASRQELTGQFQRGSLPEKISSAIEAATIPDGYAVWGAVVAIGCDVPESVIATPSGDGWVFEPQMPSETMQVCFAPVTSVALVAAPAPVRG
jgi:hypothetical protein